MPVRIAPSLLSDIIQLGREPSNTQTDLENILRGMDKDDQVELVALVWIGRGVFLPEDWDDAVEASMFEASTSCIDYLLGMSAFIDHLEAGMTIMGVESARVAA